MTVIKKIDAKKVRSKLIRTYEGYIKNPENEQIKITANKISSDYGLAALYYLLDETSTKAIRDLDDIYFGKLSVQRARKILQKLK